MINSQMKDYSFSLILTSTDEYGQEIIKESDMGKTVRMAINLNSQSITDDIRYKDADYMGLTLDKVDDTYIIHYGKEKLKVINTNPFGRLNQVFMKRM